MNPLFVYVVIFLATVLAVEGLYSLVRARREADPLRARKRLQVLAGRLQAGDLNARQGEGSILRGLGGASLSLGEQLMQLLPNHEKLELRLYRAGMPMSPQRFLFTSAFLMGAGWLVASALLNDPLTGLLGASAGFVPWIAVNMVGKRRMRQFEAQLPDALELLTRALRAGHALGVGFQLVGEEMSDPMGIEFGQVAEEIKFGLDTRSALMNLAHRVDSEDLPYFVTAVLIQRETGGNLAELLDKLGGLIRERAKFHGKLRALTAQGRMTAGVLAVWPAITVALLMITNPKYIAPLIETRSGHIALLVAAAFCVTGYIIARRLADVRP